MGWGCGLWWAGTGQARSARRPSRPMQLLLRETNVPNSSDNTMVGCRVRIALHPIVSRLLSFL
eukprot:scaffold86726_cov25-Prasinocladus_malaysianus.AAC.2